MTTIEALAQTLSAQWESGTRSKGETFRMVKEGPHKEAITGIIYACHNALGGCLPNDWVYEKVENAIDAIASGVEQSDYSDSNVDIYNHDLKQWLFQPFADAYIEEATGYRGGLYEKIAHAQYLALLDIYAQVVSVLEELIEE